MLAGAWPHTHCCMRNLFSLFGTCFYLFFNPPSRELQHVSPNKTPGRGQRSGITPLASPPFSFCHYTFFCILWRAGRERKVFISILTRPRRMGTPPGTINSRGQAALRKDDTSNCKKKKGITPFACATPYHRAADRFHSTYLGRTPKCCSTLARLEKMRSQNTTAR